jgi:type I restriction enzyme M protein
VNNILQYESEIWATADLLRGCGIKESEWPSYMMPFFALIMIESRLIRLYEEEIQIAGGLKAFEAMREDDRLALLLDKKQGYNKYLFEQKKSLTDICANDKTFEIDFDAYLKGFDEETKDLLGVDPGDEGEKFLNIKNYISILKSKKVLLGYVKKWSEIDLKPYSNSDITTLEEHIKRRWADMSAETAGEQYTPDDVIALMADIVASKIEVKETLLKIYDPACGGGNLLFGVEDRIKEVSTRLTQTFGQELNDALFALAKIESRFREDSKIEAGNTLTDDKFYSDEFDVSIANPPFGVDWKGFQTDIRNDKTGRYKYLPSVGDGQLLFTQHLISKMAHDGVAVIVHNGSTLFSGDAGSNESNIRKWMLDADIVEAVIQLPTDEFFNTGIYTYLWVLNKNKKPHQKDKVMLINTSEKYKQLKKSKGAKRKEVDKASRLEIVNTLTKFEDNDYARVFDKEFFYFNKQAILLTNVDEQGQALSKSMKLSPIKLENGQREITEFDVDTVPKVSADSQINSPNLRDVFEKDIKPFLDSLDYKEQPVVVTTSTDKYYYDNEQETLIEESKGEKNALGCGKIVVKASYKSANKKQGERFEITVELTPDTEKDYEIIPFHRDEAQNKAAIADFMAKYVTKPFEYQDNIVGVEINFNKVFYSPEKLDDVVDILAEITKIDNDLKSLEEGLGI